MYVECIDLIKQCAVEDRCFGRLIMGIPFAVFLITGGLTYWCKRSTATVRDVLTFAMATSVVAFILPLPLIITVTFAQKVYARGTPQDEPVLVVTICFVTFLVIGSIRALRTTWRETCGRTA